MDATLIGFKLIAALEERNHLYKENCELKRRLGKYEPEVLRAGEKNSEGPGRVIQLVPKFTNLQNH